MARRQGSNLPCLCFMMVAAIAITALIISIVNTAGADPAPVLNTSVDAKLAHQDQTIKMAVTAMKEIQARFASVKQKVAGQDKRISALNAALASGAGAGAGTGGGGDDEATSSADAQDIVLDVYDDDDDDDSGYGQSKMMTSSGYTYTGSCAVHDVGFSNNHDEQLRLYEQHPTVPSDVHYFHGTTYQILIPSFFDGDGDGDGDLRGIIDRLDYIQETGFEAIYLVGGPWTGVSYYGFDVLDETSINPRWGTLGQFRQLVAGAHQRGIRVVVELQLHSTAYTHPLFQAALAGDATAMARYNITAGPRDQELRGLGDGGESRLRIRDWFSDSFLAQEYFNNNGPDYRFTRHFNLLQLDQFHPLNRERALDIVKFWTDLCVDGFRVDLPRINGRAAASETWATTTLQFNDWLVREARNIKPDLFFLPEANNPYWQEMHARTFGGVYDAEFYRHAEIIFSRRFRWRAFGSGREAIDADSDDVVPLWQAAVSDITGMTRAVHVTRLDDHDDKRMMSRARGSLNTEQWGGSYLWEYELEFQPESGYSPAANGTVRIHFKPPPPDAVPDDFTFSLFYFFPNSDIGCGYEVSGDFETGGIGPGEQPNNATCGASCPSFLGTGYDAYGFYWDFDIVMVDPNCGGNKGFVLKEKDGFDKLIEPDLLFQYEDTVNATAQNHGDWFIDTYYAGYQDRPTETEKNRYKSALAFQMTWPGSPLVFAGGEFGAEGDTQLTAREALLWGLPCANVGQGKPCQVEKFSPREESVPGSETQQTIPNLFNEPTQVVPLVEQLGDDSSIYEYAKRAILTRRDNAVLRRGSLHAVPIPGIPQEDEVLFDYTPDNTTFSNKLLAYRRSLYHDNLYVVINQIEDRRSVLVNFDASQASQKYLYRRHEYRELSYIDRRDSYSLCNMHVHYSHNVARLDWTEFVVGYGGALVVSFVFHDTARSYQFEQGFGNYVCRRTFFPEPLPLGVSHPAYAAAVAAAASAPAASASASNSDSDSAADLLADRAYRQAKGGQTYESDAAFFDRMVAAARSEA